MVHKMDKKWKEIYDEKASSDLPFYEMSCWSEEGYSELLEVTKNLFFELKEHNEISSVLDVGCGAGEYCNFFFEQGLNVKGVDYSRKTVEVAKKSFPKVDFFVEDGYNLSFKDESFDLIVSIGALQCLYDHEKFLSELMRVSKRFVIVSTLYRDKRSPDPYKVLERQLENDSWPTREYHPSELIDLFKKNGFRTKLITKNGDKLIRDGFFVVAEKFN